MKTLFLKKTLAWTLLTFTLLLMESSLVFSQTCNVSSTLLTENFDGYTGGAQNQTDINNYLASRGQTAGRYAGGTGNCTVKGITNNAKSVTTATTNWKRNVVANSCSGTGPCADCSGPNNYTDNTSGGTNTNGKVYIVDGCGNVPNGSIWCYTSSGSYGAGAHFRMTAHYTSPWCNTAPTNNPAMYFTINGQLVSASLAVVTQYSGSSSPWYKQECYYTLPAGTPSAPVEFCINMSQQSSGTYGVANNSGNDLMLDDIKIEVMTGSGCASNSGSCSYTGPVISLPVELLAFAVEKSSQKALLKWSTASEKNFSHFSVEKSADGINFTRIGTVNARGSSSAPASYEFHDYDFNRTSYYRLKMVDIDGTHEYSQIRALLTEKNIPVIRVLDGGRLQIFAEVSEDTEWNCTIYSFLGQVFLNEDISLKKGNNSIEREITGVKPGSAKIVRITSREGEVVFSEVIAW